jgi:hypothetical protein
MQRPSIVEKLAKEQRQKLRSQEDKDEERDLHKRLGNWFFVLVLILGLLFYFKGYLFHIDSSHA